MNELQAARSRFPALERLAYLDLAARGVLSGETEAAVNAHLRDAAAGAIDKERLFRETEQARGRFAALINAEPDEVTFTKNTSEGLNALATALQWRRGDNVVLCPALEHPNNVYLWLALRRQGVEVRAFAPDSGRMPLERMIAAMDARTRLVSASSVSFSPGYRTDIDRLGAACRARGALFLVDAAQSAGVLHTDVRRMPIDALATSTQKGLLALYGMGFLYVRRTLADTLVPASIARFGIDVGANAHESDLGSQELKLLPGARRFDLGNYNYAGVCAVNASLKLLAEYGTQAIERHVLALARALAGGLRELGLPVHGPSGGADDSHIVCLGYYGDERRNGYSDDELQSLYAHLGLNGVRLSMRRGLLRFSFHLYNDRRDVERVLALVREWRR